MTVYSNNKTRSNTTASYLETAKQDHHVQPKILRSKQRAYEIIISFIFCQKSNTICHWQIIKNV